MASVLFPQINPLILIAEGDRHSMCSEIAVDLLTDCREGEIAPERKRESRLPDALLHLPLLLLLHSFSSYSSTSFSSSSSTTCILTIRKLLPSTCCSEKMKRKILTNLTNHCSLRVKSRGTKIRTKDIKSSTKNHSDV